MILAINGNELIGAAQIKLKQLTIYPDKEHWLAGVYVEPKHRGNKVASALLKKIEETAIELGVCELHLQTENLTGGLYSSLGWQSTEKVNYRGVDVMVMSKQL